MTFQLDLGQGLKEMKEDRSGILEEMEEIKS